MTTFNSKSITENVNDISIVESKNAQGSFCSVWPGAKQALELLQGILKNPIAKGAVGIVIAAGDAVASKICG